MNRRRHLHVLWLLAFIAPPPVWAADESDRDSQLGLGIGAWVHHSPYRDIANRAGVLPLVDYENRYLHLFGNEIDVKVVREGAFELAWRTKFAVGEGYKASDAIEFSGMDQRKGSINTGLVAAWRAPFAKLTADWLADVSGHSKGQGAKLEAEHAFRFAARFEITPRLAASWLDRKYVDYYYGVKPSEATQARPAYAGRSTTNLEAGVRLGYLIDKHQRVLFDVDATRWGEGITESPLVGRKTTPGARIGYLYRF